MAQKRFGESITFEQYVALPQLMISVSFYYHYHDEKNFVI